MKPHALIIDDDPAIREALADRLESLGHDCEAVGSQTEARERLGRCSFSYILLDLELPVRFGRPPSIQIGKNILLEIRSNNRHAATPVLVVTAHGHDRPDLAVEVMKAGATDFVKKPFDNLEQAIREALNGHGNGRDSAPTPSQDPPDRRKLENAGLVYQPDALDLDGVTLCTPDNGVIWRILLLLRERKANGQPKAFPGKLIADTLGLSRGQNAVCDAVSPFRKKVVDLLDEEGIDADEDSVIVTGKSGYQLNPALSVVDHLHQAPATTATKESVGADDRQRWFLTELAKGRKLRRGDLENHFGISTATAKRDFSDLAGQIDFVGSGKAGYYALAQGRG
jgi:DNA-binding response OmpR family regulator